MWSVVGLKRDKRHLACHAKIGEITTGREHVKIIHRIAFIFVP